jgi:release factor glutamine methyltransferase
MERVRGSELWAWYQDMRQRTEQSGIAPRELDWLLSWVSDLDSLTLRLGTLRQLPEVALKLSLQELSQLWQQRLTDRVPVQYLVGQTAWRNFTLQVSPSVLIPRPETELMIDRVVEAVEESPQKADLKRGTWVDMGTGSGAIALALADAFPEAHIVAVDQSADALTVAQQNALSYTMENRIAFYQGRWFEPFDTDDSLKGCFLSGMVSNPPYIPTEILSGLQPEVVDHEPVTALDGGKDGLEHIRTLAHQALHYLVPGGLWMVEMMAGQGEAVQEMLAQTGHYRDIQIHRDLAGLDRFVMAFRDVNSVG